MAGRYDKGTNLDVYLKGHAGEPITVDRIGRKSNHIPGPRLSMMLAIQPQVLNGLMDNPTFRGRGLCGRFLYGDAESLIRCVIRGCGVLYVQQLCELSGENRGVNP